MLPSPHPLGTMRITKIVLTVILVVYLVPAALSAVLWSIGDHPASWRGADWSSAGLLPPADAEPDAAVYILSARTGGLKGAVSEHSWIVVKNPGARAYERWDKVGWGSPIRHNAYPADGRWYSNDPQIVAMRRGAEAEALIPAIRRAVEAYPFAMRGGYTIFPGPNSNTFVAHVLRTVPELHATLPTTAVGRDYPADGRLAAFDGARGDLVLSVFGYAGLTLGRTSGIEVQLLGLVAGIDIQRLGIKVPAFGTFALLRPR